MDEPSDGLHAGDIERITDLFNSMVEAGNSIFLIEHNIEMLKACDYLIELGPGGGAMGWNDAIENDGYRLQGYKTAVTRRIKPPSSFHFSQSEEIGGVVPEDAAVLVFG